MQAEGGKQIYQKDRPTVLCFVGYFEPGYKGGGPIRSISNMVENKKEEYNFKIVCLDRDAFDEFSYPGLPINSWFKRDSYDIYYLSSDYHFLFRLIDIVRNTKSDFFYLNSFFAIRFSFIPLLISFIINKKTKYILAPRGEFSSDGLNISSLKKKLYIPVFKKIIPLKRIKFHSTSDYETSCIQTVLEVSKNSIRQIPNYVANSTHIAKSTNRLYKGPLRIVFISRITPMKNLLFAIDVLSQIDHELIFDIYGVIDNYSYWRECLKKIKSIPNHIKITYKGAIAHKYVSTVFRKYDLFFLPSLGENFGHVIPESIYQGTPVLTSNAVRWSDLETYNCGWLFSLDCKYKFVEIINYLSSLDDIEMELLRKKSISFAHAISDRISKENNSLALFI